METKTLKIEVPNGYEIDKEKSTFENIVFKKVDNVVIKWNKCYNGVEIEADGEHFVLDGNPTFSMSWNDAMRFYYKHSYRNLPTIKQLQVVYIYFDEINEVIKSNGGFLLYKRFYWCNEEKDEFNSLGVSMGNGFTSYISKTDNGCARGVSTL
jgi:Cdc6-like AAA superfamily ATPase